MIRDFLASRAAGAPAGRGISRDARSGLRPAAVLILAAPLMVSLSNHAIAHDALHTAAQPQGWAYPFSCCSGHDCREVGKGFAVQIGERPEGYVISSTGEVVGYGDARLKNSPDGEFHWCSVAGANDGRTICLFAPPRGF